eukprot:Nk52_evm9s150 gene=Nk52_evmTU9s150
MAPMMKSKWGDEVDDLENHDLPPTEVIGPVNGIKKIISYRLNEDGVKEKITRSYKIETRKVRCSKGVLARKELRKFGDAANEPAGPNPHNTNITDPVYMTFAAKDGEEQQPDAGAEDPLKKLKGGKLVQCRICKGEHWTTKCPYKDTLGPVGGSAGGAGDASSGLDGKDSSGLDKAGDLGVGDKLGASSSSMASAGGAGKYIPPNMRNRGADGGSSMPPGRGDRGPSSYRDRDDSNTLRVTNLSEDTRESDLQDLFRPFGQITRVFLAKDKVTGLPKGFGFVTYANRSDGQKAIDALHGFGYDHLILSVDWSQKRD